MTKDLSDRSVAIWSGLFPITYLIHIAEEYWGGEGYSAYIFRLRGVHLSPARFWVAQSIGVVLMTIGVILAHRLKFPRTMLVILGATVLINGLTHLITSISIWSYGPGLYTSIFIWIPLGLVTLIRAKSIVSKRNYWMAIAIGIGINVVIGVLTMRGARLV